MDIQLLEEFITLAEKINFLEAAESMHISQSSLSKHIKKLEDELGVPLFHRTTRTVLLGEFGQLLLPYAKKIVELNYEFSAAVNDKLHKDSGNIILGSIPSMKPHNITDLIAGFLKENSGITLQTIEGDSAFINQLLLEGKCDIAFLRSDEASIKDFISFPYLIDSLVAVLPATHPLAGLQSIQLSRLSGETFLLFPEQSYMNKICIRACRNAGFEPNIAYTGSRGANIIDLVRKGAGITLMMHRPTEYFNDKQLAHINITPGIYSYISLNYRKDKPLSFPAAQFVRYVQNHKQE